MTPSTITRHLVTALVMTIVILWLWPTPAHAQSSTTIRGTGLQPLVEESGSSQTLNIYGPGGVIIAQVATDSPAGGTPTTQTRYLLHDHLGSTRVVLDSNNQVLGSFDYSPFGETTPTGTVADVAYRYTGQEVNGALGTYNYHARHYDAGVGRFLTVDPARQFASSYVYVGNNPINHTDPTGNIDVPLVLIDYDGFNAGEPGPILKEILKLRSNRSNYIGASSIDLSKSLVEGSGGRARQLLSGKANTFQRTGDVYILLGPESKNIRPELPNQLARLNEYNDQNKLTVHQPVTQIRIIDATGNSTIVTDPLRKALANAGFKVDSVSFAKSHLKQRGSRYRLKAGTDVQALRDQILFTSASVAGPSGASVTAGPSTSSGATGFGPPSSSAGASGVNPSLLSDFDTVGSLPQSHLGPPPLRHLGPILQPHELDHLKLSDDLFTGISPLSLPELGSSTFNVLD